MLSSIDIQNVAPIRAASVQHLGPYPGIGAAFERLFMWAGPRGLVGPATRTIGVYYDSPRETPAEQLRSRACIEVEADAAGDPAAGVEIMTLPGGRCLVAMFKGSYAGLPEAWDGLVRNELPKRQLSIAPDRPCFEVYLNDPSDTAPDELLTAIHIPV